MSVFFRIWLGQLVSLMGSGLTGFALGLWVLQRTGSVTKFALISALTVLPRVLLSPLAGVLVDRWDRRRTIVLAEVTAGVSTLILLLLVSVDRLELWHIYLVTALLSVCSAFQWPAFTAATAVLVPQHDLGRAAGLVQLAHGLAQTLAPLIATTVMGSAVRLERILAVDASTYVIAVAVLLGVSIPSVRTVASEASVWRDMKAGFAYLRENHGLLALIGLMGASNMLFGLIVVLVSPLVLSFSTPQVLGVVMTTAGCGMFAGSVAMSAWGGPKRRVRGILGFIALGGIGLVPAGLPPSAMLLSAGAFCFLFCIPIIGGCTQAVLQSKVPAGLQGRVFSVSGMIATAAMPLAYLAAGPLADRVFEPLMAHGGPLANSIGLMIGTGPGRGIALAFVLLGIGFALTAAIGYSYRPVRELDDSAAEEAVGGMQSATTAAASTAA